MEDRQHSALTDAIICCFYNVYNKLGYGFLEKVYGNALAIEMKAQGISAVAQCPIAVRYEGQIVGEYFCDLMAEEKIIVEIKATKQLLPEHEAQLLNYLKATDIEVGLLLNFGPKPEVRRKVFRNSRKINGTHGMAERSA
jgi:GxxExxY protein